MSTETLIHGKTPEHAHHDNGSLKVFGFWIYLMSDLILFSCLFATYIVLLPGTAGGPSGKDIFDLVFVLEETFALLLSSITYGFAVLAMNRNKQSQVLLWLIITFVLGACFIGMELHEFHQLIAENKGPNISGYLSGFFALVGTHGLHVTAGLIWMAVMMIQVASRGLTSVNRMRINCLSLFWHFLDIVWICVFSIVYLMGVAL
ncbi:cytochrome o ubiquinol oxidase subunit III [Snodgrassella gandavensis]|uniref:cytochrome o ubiquinol oxidase subunit III n=1 Tax=Snodgrassella gandavensis TaxID=2946698 RepID=UPI001EF6B548|nr:cytochrome o ubiquinol oxidase subunit III [Snodgrassella gandavensis]